MVTKKKNVRKKPVTPVVKKGKTFYDAVIEGELEEAEIHFDNEEIDTINDIFIIGLQNMELRKFKSDEKLNVARKFYDILREAYKMTLYR